MTHPYVMVYIYEEFNIIINFKTKNSMKTKLKNQSKFKIFFLLLLIINFSCEKENVFIEPVNEQSNSVEIVKSWFELNQNKYDFKILDYTESIDWNNTIITYGDKGYSIEAPIILKETVQTNFKNDPSFNSYNRLLFLTNDYESYEVLHAHILTQDNTFETNQKQYNFYRLNNSFNGFITLLDAKNKIVSFSQYEEGYFVKPPIKENTLLKYEPVTCVYFGWWYESGHFEAISLLYCYGGSDSDGNPEFRFGPHAPHGDPDLPANSIDDDKIDDSQLSGKEDCVYDKLNDLSDSFKEMIQKFDGDFPVSHLKFESVSSLPNNVNARTLPPQNYLITIQINSNNISRPNLSIARTFIHETIHAEMFRRILSIMDNGGDLDGLTRQQWTQKLSNGDYPGIFDYYSRYGVDGMQHEQIAGHYRSTISDMLKEFQPGLSQDVYDALAWEGLKGTTTWNSLSQEEKNNIVDLINDFNNLGSEDCN